LALPYRAFAFWTLYDLARREREGDRIMFVGNHISETHNVPVRSQSETIEQFRHRLKAFWKSLPRRSDLSERLALAYEAYRRAGEDTYSAAHEIMKILRVAPAIKQAEYERGGVGFAYTAIDSGLGLTNRGRRTRRKKRGVTAEERMVHSIRTQASRFIARHRDSFNVLFDERLDSFRGDFSRDAEWYAAAERHELARVEALEKRSDYWAAMPLGALAQLYHEQGKFPQALIYYRKALQLFRKAIMHKDFRTFAVGWMRVEVKLCLRKARMVPLPAYGGPWVPEDPE